MSSRSTEVNIQQREIFRVRKRLEPVIEQFFADKGPGAQFHMSELNKYVSSREACAPESPGRIMRALSRKGRIAYELIDRARSLYCVLDPAQAST